MFHKIKNVISLKNYVINVYFEEGINKQYDVKPLFKKIKIFNQLKKDSLFEKVQVGQGGYGVVWNDEIDLSSEELFNNGEIIDSSFDNRNTF